MAWSLLEAMRPTPASVVEEPSKAHDSESGKPVSETPVNHDGESISSDAQAGVQAAEAITSVWSKSSLILAYFL